MMGNDTVKTAKGQESAMAKQVVTEYVDDYTGGGADKSTGFAFEGIYYGLDLSIDNLTKLRADLAPWMEAASEKKKVGKTPTARTATPAKTAKKTSAAQTGEVTDAEIRAWAIDKGHEVNARGRIPTDLKQRYFKAHKGRKAQ